jgi:hypothetical protein
MEAPMRSAFSFHPAQGESQLSKIVTGEKVCLVFLVYLVQPNKRDKQNKPDEPEFY